MLRFAKIAFVLLLAIAAVSPAGAWSTPYDFTGLVNYECSPRAVRDSSGWKHVVWFGGPSGDWDINYQKTQDGVTWTSPVAISSATDAGYPDIAIGGSGNLHVVWHQGNPADIYYRSCIGGTWGSIVNLSNTSTKSVNARIAISLVADEIIVTWQEDGQNGADYDIITKRRTGGVWQSNVNVSNDSSYSGYPDVACASDGVFHLVWEDTVTKNVYFSSYTPGGSWTSKLAIDGTADRSYLPSIAICGTDIHVAWEDSTPGNWDTYYRRRTGSTWGSVANISNNGRTDATPCIDVDTSNNAYVTWDDYGTIYYNYQVGGVWQGTQSLPGVSASKNSFILRTPGGSNVFWQAQPSGSWDSMFSWQ